MTDLYKIVCKEGYAEIPTIRDAIGDALRPMLDAGEAIDCAVLAQAVMGVLVKVKPCEHGKIDWHMVPHRQGGKPEGNLWATLYKCEGAGLEDNDE